MMFLTAALLPVSAFFAQVAAAPAAVDFSTSAATPGVWSYRSVPATSDASFMDTSAVVRLSVHCTRGSWHVTLSRTSQAPATNLFVWTSSAQRMLPARFDPRTMRVNATLAPNDPLLDAIAYSRGRFVVSMPGAVPLVVAPSPEAARVFEDCRN